MSGPHPDIEFGATTLGLDSLAAVVNRRALSIGSVKVSGDLRVVTPSLPRGKKVDVSLLAQRPDRVRMQGRYGALVSLFDLLADGDSLSLYLPRERALVVESARGGSNLPLAASGNLVQAILHRPLEPRTVPSSGFRVLDSGYEITTNEPDGGAGLSRELVFEPRNLKLMRQVIRVEGPAHRETIIHYARHAWTGTQWLPGFIRVELPETGENLELRILKYEANPALKPAAFSMPVPGNARRLSSEELSDRFLSEAPDG